MLESARALVADRGVRGASVSAIARHARVGKPSVYLRWRNLTAIIVAAVGDLGAPLADVGGGSVEESLVLAVEDDHGHLVRGPHLAFLSAVLYASASDAEIARELWASVLGPRRDRLVAILRTDPVLAAVGPGRLVTAADLLQAPILHDMARRSPHPARDTTASTASVVRGIGTR